MTSPQATEEVCADRPLNLLFSLVSVGVRGLRLRPMKRQRPLCVSVRLSDGSRPESCRCLCVWCALHLSSRALRHWRTVWLRPFWTFSFEVALFLWSSGLAVSSFLRVRKQIICIKTVNKKWFVFNNRSLYSVQYLHTHVYGCYLSLQFTAVLLLLSASSCSHIEKVGWIKKPKHNSDYETSRHTHACMHADAFAERIAEQQLWGYMAGTVPFICYSAPVSEGSSLQEVGAGEPGEICFCSHVPGRVTLRRDESVFPKPPEVDEAALEQDVRICWKI